MIIKRKDWEKAKRWYNCGSCKGNGKVWNPAEGKNVKCETCEGNGGWWE